MHRRLALALAASLWCMPTHAQSIPPISYGAESSLRMIVVHWKIKPGQERAFLDYWSTKATIEDRSGLLSEFLSAPEDRAKYPWINWDTNAHYTSFYNVGLWRTGEDFQQQIGRFVDNTKPLLEFEAERRQRIFLSPERWRAGPNGLPQLDAPGVR